MGISCSGSTASNDGMYHRTKVNGTLLARIGSTGVVQWVRVRWFLDDGIVVIKPKATGTSCCRFHHPLTGM